MVQCLKLKRVQIIYVYKKVFWYLPKMSNLTKRKQRKKYSPIHVIEIVVVNLNWFN